MGVERRSIHNWIEGESFVTSAVWSDESSTRLQRMLLPLSIHRSWLKSVHVSYTTCSLSRVVCFCRGSTVSNSLPQSWRRSPAAEHGQFRRDLKTILFAQPYHLVDSALRVLSKQSSYINYSHFYLLTYTTFARARTHAHIHTHTHTHTQTWSRNSLPCDTGNWHRNLEADNNVFRKRYCIRKNFHWLHQVRLLMGSWMPDLCSLGDSSSHRRNWIVLN